MKLFLKKGKIMGSSFFTCCPDVISEDVKTPIPLANPDFVYLELGFV